MRGIGDVLGVQQILGNVKVQGQGVQKLKSTQKSSNKQKKQNADKSAEESGFGSFNLKEANAGVKKKQEPNKNGKKVVKK
jgi:hypothetical protein